MFTAALNLSEQQQDQDDSGQLQSQAEESYVIKLLCPQSVTGIIIGKGGSTLSSLTAASGAKIKLSQNGEYFPGTNDRILMCKYFYSFFHITAKTLVFFY